MIFYGAGQNFRLILQDGKDKEITMVVDSHPELYPNGVEGYPVYSKQKLHTLTENDLVCVTSLLYYDEIVKEIRQINPIVGITSYGQYVLDKYKAEIKARRDCYVPMQEEEISNWIKESHLSEVEYWKNRIPHLKAADDKRFQEREFDYFHNPEVKFTEDDIILDVGSGPLPKFGRLIGGKKVNYIPLDPLAYRYREILQELSISLPLYPEFAIMEALTCFYPKESADFVIVNNALDHSIDIVRAFIECFNVVKNGGYLLLQHLEGEGFFENYGGLHKWNIIDIDGTLYFSDEKEQKINVSKLLDGYAEIETSWESFYYRPMIITKIHKHASISEDIFGKHDTKAFAGKAIKELFRNRTSL